MEDAADIVTDACSRQCLAPCCQIFFKATPVIVSTGAVNPISPYYDSHQMHLFGAEFMRSQGSLSLEPFRRILKTLQQ